MKTDGGARPAPRGLALAGSLVLTLLPVTATAAPGAPTNAIQAVRCAGTGAPSLGDAASNLSVVRTSTRRAAKAQALRRCRVAIEAMPLAAGGTVGEALGRDRALADAVRDALRRARLAGSPRYFADGGVALELEAPIDGALAERLATGRGG